MLNVLEIQPYDCFPIKTAILLIKKQLTHLPMVLHVHISELVITGSDNVLLPVHHAIAWTKADLLSVGPLGANLNEIRIKIRKFSFFKMHLKCPLWIDSHFLQGEKT